MKSRSSLATLSRRLARRRAREIVACILLFAGATSLTGCAKQGKYTKEHTNAAKEKMGALKAGTEYQMAHQAFLAGDLEKAQRHVKYSIELNDRVPRSHVLRGRVMMEMGNIEEANQSLTQAESLDAQNVEAQYFQGILAERLTRYEEALTRYKRAADLDLENSQYPVAAAEMLIQLNRLEEAETYLTSCQARFDHSPGIRQTLGHLSVMRNDFQAAEALFYQASLMAPNDQPITEDLIQAQMALSKFSEADVLLSKLLAKKENAPRRDLRHLRGTCLSQVQRPVEARKIYTELTSDELGSADYEAWLGLGQLSITLHDMPRVRDAAVRMVVIDAARPEGYALQGVFLRHAGKLVEARESIMQALSIRQDADTFVLLGVIETELGRTPQAQQAFSLALQVDPNHEAAKQLVGSLGVLAEGSDNTVTSDVVER